MQCQSLFVIQQIVLHMRVHCDSTLYKYAPPQRLAARRRAWLMREGSSLFRHYRSLRLPLSPKTQKSTENRCFFHALTEIRCRQNFPFFLTGEAQHRDMPYLEVPVRFNMPIYAFLHNVLLVRKLNPHTKLQCSKTKRIDR